MKTLKEALSNTEKNDLIDALEQALNIVSYNSDSLDGKEAEMLIKRLNDFNSESGRDKLQLKSYLDHIGIYNSASILNDIEKFSSYKEVNKLAKISDLTLDDFISYIQKGYSIKDIIRSEADDIENVNKLADSLMKLKEPKSKMGGPGELLLKIMLSDVIESTKDTCDVYCSNGAIEVKCLAYSSANIFGTGSLKNITKRNLSYSDIKILDELTEDMDYFRNEVLKVNIRDLNSAIVNSKGEIGNIDDNVIKDHIKVLYLKFKDYHNEHLNKVPNYKGELIIYGEELNGFILSSGDIPGNFNMDSPEDLLKFLYIMSSNGLKVIKTNEKFEFGKYK